VSRLLHFYAANGALIKFIEIETTPRLNLNKPNTIVSIPNDFYASDQNVQIPLNWNRTLFSIVQNKVLFHSFFQAAILLFDQELLAGLLPGGKGFPHIKGRCGRPSFHSNDKLNCE